MRPGVSSARVGAALPTSDSRAEKVGCGGEAQTLGLTGCATPSKRVLPFVVVVRRCRGPRSTSCFPDCCPSNQGRTGNSEEPCRGWAWTARGPVWPALSGQAAWDLRAPRTVKHVALGIGSHTTF